MSELVNKIKSWFLALPDMQKGYVMLILILLIGIIIRWNYIIDNIIKGFSYFSK